MKALTAIKDPLIVHARNLASTSGRRESNQCLLLGREHIKWGLRNSECIEHIFVSNKLTDDPLIEVLTQRKTPLYSVSPGILQKISGTKYIIPYIGLFQLRNKRAIEELHEEFVVVLDNLHDQGNIGTAIRTAAAFNINELLNTSQTTDFFSKKTIDSSRGNALSVPFAEHPNSLQAIQHLKQKNYFIVATSPHAQTLQSQVVLPEQPIALLLGNETTGLTDEVMQLADMTVKIPMNRTVESLNVSIAAGISMYELKTRMILAMLKTKIRKTLGRELGVAHKLLRMLFDKELKKVCALDARQVVFLMILTCDCFMTLEQVQKDTGLQGTELESFLSRLEQNGSIVPTKIESEPGYAITPHGEKILSELWPVQESVEHAALAKIESHEQKVLFSLLEKIQKNCSDN